MTNIKVINKEATIQRILNKCKKNSGITINIERFNEKILEPDAEEFIIDAAMLCQVRIAYD